MWVDACVCNLYQALFWPLPPPNFESLGTRHVSCSTKTVAILNYMIKLELKPSWTTGLLHYLMENEV